MEGAKQLESSEHEGPEALGGRREDAIHAAREGVLLVLEESRGTLQVTGPDRSTWLNGVVTCDVSGVTPERAELGLILSKHGKILSDLWIVAGADTLFLGVAPAQHGVIAAYLARLLVMEDAEVHDSSAGFSWLGLHGPHAAELARSAARDLGVPWGELDLTGLGGAVLVAERDRIDDARELLRSCSGLVCADREDWERLRIERGVPVFGVDYGLEDNPHEAGLDERAVSWTKGCYLGQEVVCMQGMRGKVKRRVVALRVEGIDALPRGSQLLGADGAVGEITSAAPSEVERCTFALGRVSGPALAAPEALSVQGRQATIVERPPSA